MACQLCQQEQNRCLVLHAKRRLRKKNYKNLVVLWNTMAEPCVACVAGKSVPDGWSRVVEVGGRENGERRWRGKTLLTSGPSSPLPRWCPCLYLWWTKTGGWWQEKTLVTFGLSSFLLRWCLSLPWGWRMLVLIWLAVRLKSVQIQLNTDGQFSDPVGGPTEQHFNHHFKKKCLQINW